MGQILVQTGQVSARTVAKHHQGNLAFLLDENDSERQRGVTMEIATKTLRVPHHDIVLLDAPGHADFIPVYVRLFDFVVVVVVVGKRKVWFSVFVCVCPTIPVFFDTRHTFLF
jgi:translation elongation factor EF-1alpha